MPATCLPDFSHFILRTVLGHRCGLLSTGEKTEAQTLEVIFPGPFLREPSFLTRATGA